MNNNIKQLSKEKGLSVNRLALLAKITPSDLYSVCKGEKRLYPRWRSAIASILDVDVSELHDSFDDGGDVDE